MTPGMPCGCQAEKMKKGTVVCITNQEHTTGLLIYAGRSEHSKPWNHFVKLVDMETMNSLTIHTPCKDVYAPFADPWPWFVAPEKLAAYEAKLKQDEERHGVGER